MNSSLFITLIALAIIGALAYFAAIGFRGSGRTKDVPPNLDKYHSDDELETNHLDRTLSVAVLVASLLTVMIPLYYLGEENRQEEFVEYFDEVSVVRGENLYEEFGCGNCHGVDGSGGAASYVEKRSGVSVTWAAPAINNVFYRYDSEEIRYWLIYGRANSPMPAWGLEGGGPMNDGQLDDLIDYLAHKKIHTSVHFKPLYLYDPLKQKRSYPVMDKEWIKLISLPCHNAMNEDDIDYKLCQ